MTNDSPRSNNGRPWPNETKSQTFPAAWLPDEMVPESDTNGGPNYANHEQISMSPQLPAERATPWPSDRILTALPLADIGVSVLPRGKLGDDEAELRELMTSIKYLGLSKPIVVQPACDGVGFELIHGFRRLQAFRRLFEMNGSDHWAKIPVFILASGKGLAELYRQMIDEDVMHKSMSFAQMAYLAEAYAADPATPESRAEDVVVILFQSLSRSRRDCVSAFIRLLRVLEGVVNFPLEIPRRLGLMLDREIEANPDLLAQIERDLEDWDNRSIADEMGVLWDHARASRRDDTSDVFTDSSNDGTWHHFESQLGRGRFRTTGGQVELKLERDITECDPMVLTAAITKSVNQLAKTLACG